MSDTVGFIRKLPTHLIEAFKATLEELSYADALVHVIDISNPEWEEQARVVDELIRQLGAEQTPCIRAFNKCDQYAGILPHGEDIVCISAKSHRGPVSPSAASLRASELVESIRSKRRTGCPVGSVNRATAPPEPPAGSADWRRARRAA